MRKFTLLITLLLSFAVIHAQTKRITGIVIDESGTAIPFSSIIIPGTKVGVTADENGTFLINVSAGQQLEASSQGYKPAKLTVGAEDRITIVLQKSDTELAEVIVSTGYSTKSTQRSLTTNAQVINSDQINTIRQTNLNTALAGKVAGLQLRGQSGASLGTDASLRIGGDVSLNGQTPLYIVDGTPTNSVDINPDDVEDLSVLNGPTGAAIYGPQAVAGAIVITTKRAKKGQKGIGLQLNTGVTIDKPYVLPNYQNSYAGGGSAELIQFVWKDGMPEEWKALDGKLYPDYTDDASWGPKMEGQEYIPWYAWYPGTKYSFKTASLTPQPDNIRDFYENGVTATNNINFAKAGEGYNLRASYTNTNIKGVMPTTFLDRHNFLLNGNIDLNDHFAFAANVNYITVKYSAENNAGYSNNSTGSFNSWFHRDLDMNILRELRSLTSPGFEGTPGVLASWNHANPGSYNPTNPIRFYSGNYWYNFFSYFDNIQNIFRRDRLFGDASFTYKVNNDLKFKGTYRKSLVTTWYENKVNYILERSATQTGLKNAYSTGESFFKDDRFELIGTYDKKIEDFTINILAGAEAVKIQQKQMDAATRDGLYIPDYFAINNSIGSPNLQTPGTTTVNPRSDEKRRALFGRASLSWRNMLFGDITLRNDWYSTLPPDDNAIFVKSFGVGFVFSDLVKESLPWLSFGKLRASWGETPTAVSPYSLALYYSVNPDQWTTPDGNYFTMTTPNRIVSATIKGAVSTTKEVGLDLRFLHNRLGFSATYTAVTNTNSPIPVAIDGSTGFSSKLINAGKIISNYLSLQLNADPIKTANVNWQLNTTFSKYIKNTVIALAPGVDQIVISTGAAFSGIQPPVAVQQPNQPWGMLIGGGKMYKNGQVVLNEDGTYVSNAENVRFGSVLPKFTGGTQNTISYKNLILSFNIDYQYGGKYFSLSDMWGSFSGLTARTAALNDKGNPVRNAVSDGGGIHVIGITTDDKPVDTYVEAQDYFQSMVTNNIFDEYIYDLTFVKLREVSLGYRLPVQNWRISKWIQDATFSVVARNPWLIYSKSHDFDPSEIQNVYGEDGQYPGLRSFGFNLKIGF